MKMFTIRTFGLVAIAALASAATLVDAQPMPTPSATAAIPVASPGIIEPATTPPAPAGTMAAPNAAASPAAGTQSALPGASPASMETEAPDPYLWLEDATGARAMTWVRAENKKSLGVLQGDPRFAGLYAAALKIAQAKDRIPTPTFVAGDVYNFWQDAVHVRGIWRYTTIADYGQPTPHWTTVLDLDAISKSEHANWVWEGASCLWPAEQRCLVQLSDGGEDAKTVREFDLGSHEFVRGGFVLPHGKQGATWESHDSLLVSREWKPGELTASGYPYIVKRLRRGEPLSAAIEVFRGTKNDISAGASVFNDGQNESVTIISRGLTFFTSEQYLLTANGVRRLNVPQKVQPTALLAGRLIFTLAQDWTAGGTTFKQGSLVSVGLAALKADPEHLRPTLVYQPGPRDSLGDVNTTRTHLVITTYHDVRGRAFVYTPLPGGGWSSRQLDLPDDSSIDLADADSHSEHAFLSVTGYLEPTTLWLTNLSTESLAVSKALPARFDASKDVVEQREATSKDGTQIPYFIVHPKGMSLDGSKPTILYAYGGFQLSMTPAYSSLIGKLWLERGGVYVVANIRGGGEFGPAWHDAGLKTHRQRIYDDFSAVADDLIARKVTSPAHLGIQGGSNGGLLMGVEFTQHPELYNAVDIQVPLLDMLRFEKIAAGASWVGEYGSVSVPKERAFLASISPYNNLHADLKYPEPFIWTTTKDDRVGPQHARKFAARLSEMGIPYLFYEVTEGGHGSGANISERAKTTALEITYFLQRLTSAGGT
jgi:prolyl oligopeptidase